MKKLLIIGAGGRGKLVADAALEANVWDEVCFLDNNVGLKNLPCKIIGAVDQLPEFTEEFSEVVAAFGDGKLIEKLLLEADKLGYTAATIIHPASFVSSRCIGVDDGSVILAQAVVNTHAKIGFGSFIGAGAVVGHDCILDSCVQVSPNAVLAGGAVVGKYSWIGAGSCVIGGAKIGENTIVGAGAVVIKDVPDNVVVVGNPARVIRKNE